MSKELKIRDSLIFALCAAAGLDPKSVAHINITPESIRYEVYMEPKQQGADGPLTVFVTHPYS